MAFCDKVREGVGLLNEGWLLDNVDREVGDDSSTLFSNNPSLDGSFFYVRFRRLYELIENKLATVADMHVLGVGCEF